MIEKFFKENHATDLQQNSKTDCKLRIPSKFHIGKISFIGDSVCQF